MVSKTAAFGYTAPCGKVYCTDLLVSSLVVTLFIPIRESPKNGMKAAQIE